MPQKLIPVFPLQLVLFPGMLLPLHIFEERYKEMIAFCLEEKESFAVTLVHHGAVMQTATLAEIVAVIKEYPDGRMDILTRGTERVTLSDVSEDASYLQAKSELLNDTSTIVTDELMRSGRKLLRQFIKQAGDTVDEEKLSTLASDELGFLLGANGGYSLTEKQQLLEMTDAAERLNKAIQLGRELEQRASDEILERKPINTNGKLPH